ncbi:PREDICTED: NAC domain-containing protein 19-like [Prunus mume]|uniref:NAC domain-containing protein 19-like n=1 Tax=Prunus mume TaxID=102107 RepID=A0ABM0PTD3_PRUMU|nr:PREDICTED: NAC domain-containing protein 19-like [Prunus mume]
MIRFGRAAAEEGDLSLPVGFRFRPTDEELVDYYLKNKVQGMDFHAEGIIDEIDILKFEPRDLVAKSLMKPDDENGFFFSQPEYTPKNKTKRSTEEGFWKITGREHDIRTRDTRRTFIGKKRILTFYIGHGRNSDKTNWVMHEYYIPKAHPNANQRDFVLCHLKKNVKNSDEIHTDVATTCDEGEPSTRNAFDVENQPKHGMDIQEEDTQQPENLDYFEQAKDRWLASSCSNNDHNATFADNDSASELEERLRPFNTKPFHAGELSLEMLYELQHGSSQSIQDIDIMLHNQLSRQAASSVNVAPKPQTDRVQSEAGIALRKYGIRLRSDRIALRDTSADEYYTREKTRRITYPPEKAKEPEKPKPEPEKPKAPAYHRTAADLVEKQISITKSSIDKKVPQGSMEQTQNRTTPGNWKRSFITWQTSPLKSPPSVYIFNTVLGTILFLFCVREVVLYGEWS